MKKSKFYLILIMCVLSSPAMSIRTKPIMLYTASYIDFDSLEEHVTRMNAIYSSHFDACLPKVENCEVTACDDMRYSDPFLPSNTQYSKATMSKTRYFCGGMTSSSVTIQNFAFATVHCPVGKLRAVGHNSPFGLDSFYCELPDDTPNSCPTAGNPINYLTGDKTQVEIDYVGRAGLNLTRRYLNQRQGWAVDAVPYLFDASDRFEKTITSDNQACLGHLATMEISKFDPTAPSMATLKRVSYCLEYLSSDANKQSIIFRDANGKVSEYFDKGGYYRTSASSTKIIALDPVSNDGMAWLLSYESGKRFYFDRNGFLKQTIEKSGDTIVYTYKDGKIFSKANKFGEQILFTHDELGKVKSIQLPSGKLIVYDYSSTIHSKDFPLLTSVTLADGRKVTYKYENPNFPLALTGLVDAAGVRYATWEYDSLGRAISSEHAGGRDRFTFDYTNINLQWYPKVTVTNPLQKSTTYTFTTIGGKRLVRTIKGEASTNCDPSIVSYSYNEDGSLYQTTDRNGTRTIYTYNQEGQEISREESHNAAPELARTTTTEWHPTLNLKTKIIEPGKETIYTYDDNGLLINQTTRALH